MNGRIYDPQLGRFLSADIIVQFPGNLQAYNRYSYVLNNPLRYTDPTGYFINWLKKIMEDGSEDEENNEERLDDDDVKPYLIELPSGNKGGVGKDGSVIIIREDGTKTKYTPDAVEKAIEDMAQRDEQLVEKPHIILYDELETVFPVQVKLAAPVRWIGKTLYKIAERIGPIEETIIKDVLDTWDYPEAVGGYYPEPIKSYYPTDFIRIDDHYLGSEVMDIINFQEIHSDQGFMNHLELNYNVNPDSLFQINVRRHYTEIIYGPPGGG